MTGRELGLGRRSSAFGNRGVEKRLSALAALTPLTGTHLLDLGCADGTYTVHLAKGFDRVDAVDIEPERLRDFEARLVAHPLSDRITVAQMSAEDLQFPDVTFDVVTAIEVLEHVGDLDRTLVEIHRVLKPGGRLLVTSPNRYFPFETHGFLVGGRRLRPIQGPFLPWVVPLHRRWADARAFTVRGITEQAASHDLVREDFSYIMPPFDRSRAGQRLKPLVDAIEDSPLSFFGMALVMVFRKGSGSL